jgi:hypothetical protein
MKQVLMGITLAAITRQGTPCAERRDILHSYREDEHCNGASRRVIAGCRRSV